MKQLLKSKSSKDVESLRNKNGIYLEDKDS